MVRIRELAHRTEILRGRHWAVSILLCCIQALTECHQLGNEHSMHGEKNVNSGQYSPNKADAIISEAQAKTFHLQRRTKRSMHEECQEGCFLYEVNDKEFMKDYKCSNHHCDQGCCCTNSNDNFVHIHFLQVHCIGAWSTWSGWGKCSVSCGGGGTQTRVRSCDGGSSCTKSGSEDAPCGEIPCPIDGIWGTWSPWSFCSVTCELGSMSRTRMCDDPAPAHNGLPCTGDDVSTASCDLRPCPVDGAWSPWRTWSACSVVNNDVIRSRCRKCTNPIPQHGGAFCSDKPLTSEQCPMKPDNFKPRCRCRRSRMPVIRNISVAELAAIIDELKEELTVDKTQTSMAIRKKMSAPDSRKSTTVIGALLGIIMFSVPFVFIVTIDLVNAYQYFNGRNRVWPSTMGQHRNSTASTLSKTSRV